MIAVDTNILVRYFVGADDEETHRATKLIEQTLSIDNQGYVAAVALCEIIWVMRDRYAFGYDAQIAIVQLMLAAGQIFLEHEGCVTAAIESQHPDIADAIIHFIGAKQGCTKTVTFDKKFARLSGVTLLE